MSSLPTSLWSRLTAPHGSLPAWVGRRAQMLAGALLALASAGTVSGGLLLLLARDTFVGSPALFGATMGMLWVLYGLARSRHYPKAAVASVAFLTLAVNGMVWESQEAASPANIVIILLLPIPLAALPFQHRGALVVGVITTVLLVFVGLYHPQAGDSFLPTAPFMAVLLTALVMAANTLAAQDRAELEQQARDLNEAWTRAEAAQVAKARFLATISHELHTPMNHVLGLADLMHTEELSEDQRQYLAMIQDSALHLNGLLDDIIDFVSAEAGGLKVEPRALDLADLLHSLAAQHRSVAESKGLDLILRLPNRKLEVHLDPRRLGQILNHLLRNALAFTGSGEVGLGAMFEGTRLVLSVWDTGVGISPEQQQRLFTPLTQLDDSDTRPHQGTGMGLSTAQAIARAMEGELSVRSVLGEGSTFTLTLPLRMRGQAGDQAAG